MFCKSIKRQYIFASNSVTRETARRWILSRTKGNERTVPSDFVFAVFLTDVESVPSLDEVELLLKRERNGRSRRGERRGVRKEKLELPSLRGDGRGFPDLPLEGARRFSVEVGVGAEAKLSSIAIPAAVILSVAIDGAVE